MSGNVDVVCGVHHHAAAVIREAAHSVVGFGPQNSAVRIVLAQPDVVALSQVAPVLVANDVSAAVGVHGDIRPAIGGMGRGVVRVGPQYVTVGIVFSDPDVVLARNAFISRDVNVAFAVDGHTIAFFVTVRCAIVRPGPFSIAVGIVLARPDVIRTRNVYVTDDGDVAGIVNGDGVSLVAIRVGTVVCIRPLDVAVGVVLAGPDVTRMVQVIAVFRAGNIYTAGPVHGHAHPVIPVMCRAVVGSGPQRVAVGVIFAKPDIGVLAEVVAGFVARNEDIVRPVHGHAVTSVAADAVVTPCPQRIAVTVILPEPDVPAMNHLITGNVRIALAVQRNVFASAAPAGAIVGFHPFQVGAAQSGRHDALLEFLEFQAGEGVPAADFVVYGHGSIRSQRGCYIARIKIRSVFVTILIPRTWNINRQVKYDVRRTAFLRGNLISVGLYHIGYIGDFSAILGGGM